MSPESRPKFCKNVRNLLYSFPLRKKKLKHYFILLIVTQDRAWGQLTLTATDKGIDTIDVHQQSLKNVLLIEHYFGDVFTEISERKFLASTNHLHEKHSSSEEVEGVIR